MSELSKSLGNMEYDGLIADINPKLVVSGGTLRKLGAAGTIKRGTILAKSGGTAGDNKLVALGTAASGDTETLTAYAILCDDVDVGTTDDVTVPVYLAGCFNLNKCIRPSTSKIVLRPRSTPTTSPPSRPLPRIR